MAEFEPLKAEECVVNAFKCYQDYAKVHFSPASRPEISQDMIDCVGAIFSRETFGKLSDQEKGDVFAKYSREMADYMGLEEAEFNVDFVSKVETYLSKYEYDRLSPFYTEKEKIRLIAENLNYNEYGMARVNNTLTLSYFTDKYYNTVQNKYKLNSKQIQALNNDARIILSMRHEYQHLFQFAKIKKLLNKENVEDKYAIMACYAIMKHALILDDHHNIDRFEDTNVGYFFDPLEVDARLSEIMFAKSLVADERVKPELREDLNKFLSFYVKYNMQYEDNCPLSSLVQKRLQFVKHEFEKRFGGTFLAGKVLELLEMCNMEKYLASLDRQGNICKRLQSNLIKDKEK